MTDPPSALEAWQAGGAKARSCQVYHENGYGAHPGWVVSLREGKRNIEVNGWDMQQDRGSDRFGTLPEVITEALRRWEAK